MHLILDLLDPFEIGNLKSAFGEPSRITSKRPDPYDQPNPCDPRPKPYK